MKKNKPDNILKRWYKLAQPHKGIWFGQIFTYTVYTVMLFFVTIFSAKVINCMYNGEWAKAFLFLGLELLAIIIRSLSIHIEYNFYGKQHIVIRKNVARKVYNKILTLDDNEEKKISREKIINIAINNMADLSEFPDVVGFFIGHAVQVLVTLITVFIANWIAGVLVTLVGIINFFVYFKINKKLGRILLKRHEKKDVMFKSYNKVVEGKAVINEYGINQKYQDEIVKDVDSFANEYAKYYNVTSIKSNFYNAVWKTGVYAITALMLFFVSKGSLDIAIYLIIVPYLTSCTEKLNSLFDRTNGLENMRVDVDRVNLILNLDEKQLVKYGFYNKENSSYNLGLIDVSCKGSEDSGSLKNADISFKMNSINVIKGERGSGKRNIFNLLRRRIKPDKGRVLLDNLDLYDYNKKTFKNHIDYCSSHPIFIKGSIKENLLIAKNNFNDVKAICSKLGLDKTIEKYAKGYETNIDEVKSSGVLFLLGLARALLSDCNILMIYELPQDTPETFRKKIVNYLKSNNVDKTIIIFTHSNAYDEIASLTYTVTKGKVKLEQAKK